MPNALLFIVETISFHSFGLKGRQLLNYFNFSLLLLCRPATLLHNGSTVTLGC